MLLLAAGVAVATTGAGRVVGFNVIMGAHDANETRGGPVPTCRLPKAPGALPKADVSKDCERVQRIELPRGSQPPEGVPKYMPRSESLLPSEGA
jgi:hypothetical protein